MLKHNFYFPNIEAFINNPPSLSLSFHCAVLVWESRFPSSLSAKGCCRKKLDNAKLNISLFKAHCGVKGIITDQISNKVIRDAVVRVENTKPVTVSDTGEYWKLVLPGIYTMVSSWVTEKRKPFTVCDRWSLLLGMKISPKTSHWTQHPVSARIYWGMCLCMRHTQLTLKCYQKGLECLFPSLRLSNQLHHQEAKFFILTK